MPGNPRLGLVGLALLALPGCASGPREPPGPVVSPTGIVYEPGTPPSETRFSQTATLYLTSGQLERAHELAEEGLASDSANPVHYYLAGVAHARLGHHEEADRLLDEAQRIYPAYQLEIEPEREAAWAEAFNRGTRAYNARDIDGAVAAWQGAILMYDLRLEAHRNLGTLLGGEGRYDEAIDVYQQALAGIEKRPATRFLREEEVADREEARIATEAGLAQLLLFRNRFAEAEPLLRRQLAMDTTDVQVRSNLATALSGLGRTEEARAIYSDLLSEEGLESAQLFNLGVALFRSRDFVEAGRAFQRLTELQPHSRDAWFNYANSLFAGEDWRSLTEAGDRLIGLDPLNENAALITARAWLESGDEPAALRGVERIRGVPVYVEGLQMRPGGADTRIQGRVIGNRAPPGTPIVLRFTFYGESGELGSQSLTVQAPEAEAREPFELTFPMRAAAYRYELVP